MRAFSDLPPRSRSATCRRDCFSCGQGSAGVFTGPGIISHTPIHCHGNGRRLKLYVNMDAFAGGRSVSEDMLRAPLRQSCHRSNKLNCNTYVRRSMPCMSVCAAAAGAQGYAQARAAAAAVNRGWGCRWQVTCGDLQMGPAGGRTCIWRLLRISRILPARS